MPQYLYDIWMRCVVAAHFENGLYLVLDLFRLQMTAGKKEFPREDFLCYDIGELVISGLFKAKFSSGTLYLVNLSESSVCDQSLMLKVIVVAGCPGIVHDCHNGTGESGQRPSRN